MKHASVFVLFLSTFSRVTNVTKSAPSARNFWSSRPPPFRPEFGEIVDNINAPFVELPFDAWKEPNLVIEGTHSKEDLCSLEFMARFGRPLFWTFLESGSDYKAITLAMSKLELRLEGSAQFALQDSTKGKPLSYSELIPLLAARVDLTFESNRDEAVLLEGLLVASSMRTVYSVPQHRQYLRGGYPSEPFLAEAAARAMFEIITEGESKVIEKSIKEIIGKYKNIVPSAVTAWCERGLIDKGIRGELVARMLCTLAHDISILRTLPLDIVANRRVSFSKMIPKWIKRVLKARPSNMAGETLEEAFKDGYVHFTPFVKAEIQDYWNMPKADIVIPMCICRDANPTRWCMTAILIQVKNRVDKQPILIDAQRTFGFFTKSTTKEYNEHPYITITMELEMLTCEQRKAPQPQPQSKAKPVSTVKAKQGSKGKGKEHETAMPATPERNLAPASSFVTRRSQCELSFT
ncbi:hypothetical protein C0995_014910 [Termitomyces sp. Mi166|nr:hypothetical protein C0995_014910 [Termitomyces sp. Mi166\